MSRRSTAEGDGIVYCFINESMPGICKVGVTRCSVEERMSALHTTGLPTAYKCFAAKMVSNPYFAERSVLDAFQPFRVSMKREFLQLDPLVVQCAIDMFHGDWVCKDGVMSTDFVYDVESVKEQESVSSNQVATRLEELDHVLNQVKQFFLGHYDFWDPLRTDQVKVLVGAMASWNQFKDETRSDISLCRFGKCVS